MKLIAILVGALALFQCTTAAPVFAQAKVANLPAKVGATVMTIGAEDGPAKTVSTANPMPVTCVSGCTSAGSAGSDASAANQSTQITRETEIRDRVGDPASPAAGTLLSRVDQLRTAITALGTPLQAGGMVGVSNFPTNQAVTVATLPLPTGASTSAKQDDQRAAIDTLLKPGGKVDTVIQSTSVDRGALVGQTAVTLIPADSSRRGFFIQNQSASATCYFNGLGAATATFNSYQLVAGDRYESPSTHVGTGAISFICSAANTPLYVRTW